MIQRVRDIGDVEGSQLTAKTRLPCRAAAVAANCSYSSARIISFSRRISSSVFTYTSELRATDDSTSEDSRCHAITRTNSDTQTEETVSSTFRNDDSAVEVSYWGLLHLASEMRFIYNHKRCICHQPMNTSQRPWTRQTDRPREELL